MKRRCLTAWYDDETGELVKLDVAESFVLESSLMRADVLQDLRHALEGHYLKAHAKAFAFQRRLSETTH